MDDLPCGYPYGVPGPVNEAIRRREGGRLIQQRGDVSIRKAELSLSTDARRDF
jgi:hypothetical protein